MKLWNNITRIRTVTFWLYYLNFSKNCIPLASKNIFQTSLLIMSHSKNAFIWQSERFGQNVSDWSTSTVNQRQLKLLTESIKRGHSFPNKGEQKRGAHKEEPMERSRQESRQAELKSKWKRTQTQKNYSLERTVIEHL